VDFTLWQVLKTKEEVTENKGLNPCFSGLYSLTKNKISPKGSYFESLNPCFSGLYSLTYLGGGLLGKVCSS